MSEWVALLRGINVGGVKVPGKELAALCTSLGLDAVRTVLATGNVLFSSPRGADELRDQLESALSERFGYDARVVLLPRSRMAGVVAEYPFPEGPTHHAYAVFCSDPAVLAALLDAAETAGVPPVPLPDAAHPAAAPGAGSTAPDTTDALDPGEERIAAGEGVVHWACPRGSSTGTPFSKLTSRAAFKAALTTRNLNTVRKLF